MECIDQRLRQLMDFDRATSYAKQKDSLQKEFESFLASLPGHVTLATVTPRDVYRFLIFSGDRPGDLGQIKVPEILRFPNDDGLLFNDIWGKTLRDGDENVFGVRRNAQAEICPIRGIECYIEVTRDMRVDLTCGYLFRPVAPDLGIKDAPFSSSAAESRLKSYLKEMSADNGETLHGFRSGCAITLALTGADLAEIMDHVGWSRRHTALYYMQLAKVLNPAGASARLASSVGSEPSASWQNINELKRLVCAFPATNQWKRTYAEECL